MADRDAPHARREATALLKWLDDHGYEGIVEGNIAGCYGPGSLERRARRSTGTGAFVVASSRASTAEQRDCRLSVRELPRGVGLGESLPQSVQDGLTRVPRPRQDRDTDRRRFQISVTTGEIGSKGKASRAGPTSARLHDR